MKIKDFIQNINLNINFINLQNAIVYLEEYDFHTKAMKKTFLKFTLK